MTAKSLFIAGGLTLASLSIASARSFDILLSTPVRAGSTDLKAGQYTLRVEGTQAIFTEAHGSESFTVPVKIEKNNRKFGQTAVDTANENGRENIREIDLGGSTTKLEFGS